MPGQGIDAPRHCRTTRWKERASTLSPAKATRPGFRPSIGAFSDSRRSDVPEINLFHPIYHSYTSLVGCRVDVDRTWPVRLEDEDTEDLIDLFSEPPQFVERMSPVSVQMGDQILKGRNWTEVMVKVYRHSLELFASIGRFIESTVHQGKPGIGKVPLTSLAIDPDTLHRIIEMDYESGESTYNALMEQFSDGTLSPSLTVPFHPLLPLLRDSEVRLCARISFIFYQRILKKYQAFLSRQNEDGLVVVPFWFPECAFHSRLETIFREEFRDFCKRERLGRHHLVLLLDCDQTDHKEFDVLMKSWNLLDTNGTDGKNGSRRPRASTGNLNGLHPAVEQSSVVFRDRGFSEWVVYANPSVKKLLDRTIAKVDSDLNRQEVHYGWAHFEELESLAFSAKSVLNFRQKLIKLTELGYVPLSPDFYVRGKLRGQLGVAECEPRLVHVHDNSAGGDWIPKSGTFARWEGIKSSSTNGGHEVIEPRGYLRQTRDGEIQEEGPQCWKMAWSKARGICAEAVVGDLDSCKGGMAEVLANFVGSKDAEVRRKNVMDFLANYTYVYWREHFIQHDLSEADINIHEIANRHLRADGKEELSEVESAIAGAAAQAIYFALDSARSCGPRPENFDQRALYQNVMMLTLGMCNTVYVYHWLKDVKRARKVVDLLKSELVGFDKAYERYDLAQFGVKRKCWDTSIKSHVGESRDNVVSRAASRVAACHLRPIGYTRDFTRDDELKTVNVGHLWTTEIANLNYRYENSAFCGVVEA